MTPNLPDVIARVDQLHADQNRAAQSFVMAHCGDDFDPDAFDLVMAATYAEQARIRGLLVAEMAKESETD